MAGLTIACTWTLSSGQNDAPASRTGAVGIPIRFTLESAAQVTLVIEDERGNRIRNLIAETPFPAGEHTLYWDGYDDGERGDKGELTRRRAPAGAYRVHGLTHDGIRMTYEMTVNNPGRPPWSTKDRAGGWLADHSPPADVLYLSEEVQTANQKGQARLLVCSTSAEAGDEFVWLDREGHRLDGVNDGFWGGTHLARDGGTDSAPGYYAYVFESGQRDPDNFTIEVRAFRKSDSRLESIIKYPRPRSLRTFQGNEAYGADGLAVHDGTLVFAVTMLDKLVFVDVRKKKLVGEAAVPSPRAPAFDRQGRLYLLSGKDVKRFAPVGQDARLVDEQTLVGRELEEPHRLFVDEAGNIYVSDWGQSHQVKAFDAAGKRLRTIGKPGGPQLGVYDEQRMSHPCGVAVDWQGQLWVAEGDLAPKRLSVWKLDGTFIKGLYGPAKYGGGGALDPRDRTRLYYDDNGRGIEFALDWDSGKSRVASIYCRPDLPAHQETMPGPAPERSFYAGGRQYLVNCYNGGLRYSNDRGVGVWRLDADHIARPAAMIGNGADLVNSIWGWRMKHRDAISKLWSGHNPRDVLFVWSDANGDGVAQPEEIQWVAEDHSSSRELRIGGIGLMPLVHDDLSFTTAFGTRVPAPTIDARGVPLYDLNKRTRVGDPKALRSPLIAGDRALTYKDADGWWMGFDLAGNRRWRYPATPEAEIGGPGAMSAPTRLLGPPVTPRGGEAGPVAAINGEMGAIFLMTMDGLFVQTLGGDARLLPPLSEPQPKRGWLVKDVTFQQEHFHPTIGQTVDGNIYLVVGFQQSSLLKLEGWDAVRRRDFGELKVSEQDVAGLPATSVQPGRKEGRLRQTIAVLERGRTIDGDLSDWQDADWLSIDGRTAAALAVDGENLYVAFRTADPNALDNAGKDHRYVFKSGGALDVMLGTNLNAPRERSRPAPGDLRLLVTRLDGKTTAVLFRAVASEAPKEEAVLFESPIGKAAFDQVRVISEHVQLAQAQGNYEFSVPLKVLGLKPARGKEILADVGVLRGKEGRTVQRVHWNNTDTVLVSDIPSEARLQPARWGVLQFR
jgi:hypothetical protein